MTQRKLWVNFSVFRYSKRPISFVLIRINSFLLSSGIRLEVKVTIFIKVSFYLIGNSNKVAQSSFAILFITRDDIFLVISLKNKHHICSYIKGLVSQAAYLWGDLLKGKIKVSWFFDVFFTKGSAIKLPVLACLTTMEVLHDCFRYQTFLCVWNFFSSNKTLKHWNSSVPFWHR